MNKNSFLDALQKCLCQLPKGDVEQSVQYYSEIIDDKIEGGQSEGEAVVSLGAPEKIAEEILGSFKKEEEQKPRTVKKKKGWQSGLLIAGAPLGVPLAIAFLVSVLCVGLSVYVSAVAAVISVAVIVAALSLYGVACVSLALITVFTGTGALCLFYASMGFVCIGAFIMLIIPTINLLKLSVSGSKLLFLLTKRFVVRKGARKNEKN